MVYKRFTLNVFFLATLLMCSVTLSAQSADAGKKLFKDYCAQCHAKNMKSALTGPPLGGVEERWGNQEDLYGWIRNSQSMISSGNPRAVELWNEWKPTIMTSFEALKDEEIASILLYVNGMYDGTYGAPAASGPVAAVAADTNKNDLGVWLYPLLLLALAALALFLAKIINTLNALANEREGLPADRKSVWQILTSKGVMSFLIFGLIVFAGYTTVTRGVNLGRQQGYAPDQPIKFSHETHAGVNKIDCQYCHDGARRSKHSVIPATNTCLNCHAAIKNGSQYGTAEITKIYASAGWNPNTGKYIENIEEQSLDDLKAIYTKFMADQYIEADGDLITIDNEGEGIVQRQWADLVSSLTNDQKKTIYGPIEWIRVHNLPDHVYFNHSQHVNAGKVECQTCHGKVEEMKVVAQHSPLSMGWCVNCHRETGIQFQDNEYYESYAKYHEQMKNGEREKVTVAEIGGLECQKCHY